MSNNKSTANWVNDKVPSLTLNDKLKELIKKKFLFMVYNVSDYSLKEITTYTVFA